LSKKILKPVSGKDKKSTKGICVKSTLANIEKFWDSWYVEGLKDFIREPNLTPMVDKEYLTNGKIEKAIEVVDQYVKKI
jgi:hypothetical protein